jgi:hypothetical protein
MMDGRISPEEQEQRDRKTMDLAERKVADRMNAEHRRKARIDYEKYSTEAAEADLKYRTKKSVSYVELRAKGETSEGARIRAEAESAPDKRDRDIAAGLAKSALLRVDEAESERVSIRDIHKTSERIDGLAA